MTWLKTDDRYADHRKIRRLSDGAYRLHHEAQCHAAHDESDGWLPTDDIPELQHGKRLARFIPELVAAGLWEPRDGGWEIHDFLDWNPSHAALEAEREANRRRQASARARRKGAQQPSDEDASNGVTNGVTNGGVTRESQAPVPNRTEPFRTEPFRPVVDGSPQASNVTQLSLATRDGLTIGVDPDAIA